MTSKFLVRRTRRRGPDRGAGLGTIVRVSSGPGGLRNSVLWIVDLCLLLETGLLGSQRHCPIGTLSQDFHVHNIWVQLWPLGRDLTFEARRGQISLAALGAIPLSSCLPHPSNFGVYTRFKPGVHFLVCKSLSKNTFEKKYFSGL